VLPFFLAPDAMLATPNLPKLSRNWPLVAIAGAAGFAVGIALFALCGTSWIVAVLTGAATPVGALVVGLPFGLGAAASPVCSSIAGDASRQDCFGRRSTT
jgi:uncharacterized membrane protein YedE/YeeE